METLKHATGGLFEKAQTQGVDAITKKEWNAIETVSMRIFGNSTIADTLIRNETLIDDKSIQSSIDAKALAYITAHGKLTADMIVAPFYRTVKITGMPWTKMKENTWEEVEEVMNKLLPENLWTMVNDP